MQHRHRFPSIAATYDQRTGVRTLYLDGQLLVQDSPGPNGATPANFAIGRICMFCAGGEFFDGLIDDVAVFDVALSADQVATIMGSDLSAFGGPVPEPSTFVLAGLAALGGLFGARRRERSK